MTDKMAAVMAPYADEFGLFTCLETWINEWKDSLTDGRNESDRADRRDGRDAETGRVHDGKRRGCAA